MADEATTTTPEAEAPKADEFKAPASQADFDKIIESRVARERAKYADHADLAAKAKKFDEAQEANKTELEKFTERTAKAEQSALTATQRADRAEVALEKGLTPTQAKRLVGATREEMLADADELLKDLKADASNPPHAARQKTSTSTPQDDPMREFAQNLFKPGE